MIVLEAFNDCSSFRLINQLSDTTIQMQMNAFDI